MNFIFWALAKLILLITDILWALYFFKILSSSIYLDFNNSFLFMNIFCFKEFSSFNSCFSKLSTILSIFFKFCFQFLFKHLSYSLFNFSYILAASLNLWFLDNYSILYFKSKYFGENLPSYNILSFMLSKYYSFLTLCSFIVAWKIYSDSIS